MPTESPPPLTIRNTEKRLGAAPHPHDDTEELTRVTPFRTEARYRLAPARFTSIQHSRTLGFSLRGVAKRLKRLLESIGADCAGPAASFQAIRDALEPPLAARGARIGGARRERRTAWPVGRPNPPTRPGTPT